MIARDSLKEKTIIIADHHNVIGQQIHFILEDDGFSNIRHAGTTEKIRQVLRSFYEQPEKIGLIIINENLQNGQLADMHQNISNSDNTKAIPFLILCDGTKSEQPTPSDNKNLTIKDNWLTHKLITPINRHELLLVVNFLLKLRLERLFHKAQIEHLILEQSEKVSSNEKLEYLVDHDELTGMLNRRTFERQLSLALTRSNKLLRDAALMFIEVDRFYLINEWKGIDVSDRLLVELTTLMRKLSPANSLFSRINAGEFCIFLEDMNKSQVQKFAERFKNSIENFNFSFDDLDLRITIAIGISTLDDLAPGENTNKIILYAHHACHLGKINRPNKIGLHNAQDNARKERQSDIHWIPIIKNALRENQLFLLYQPVVDLNNGVISHYEVLLRMRCNEETISPNLFIPVAERIGLIQAIDLWVIENTIDFLASLPPQKSYVSVSIKLSASAFQFPDLVDVIRDKLELTWIDASRLIFEIAEPAVMKDYENALHMVNKIRAIGCKFAMKNSGIGFYDHDKVKTFPVHYIKINGQFIRHLTDEGTDPILLKSMANMFEKLGKKTIFFYVESTETVQRLREIGINFAQGYTLGKPECNLLEGPTIPFAQYISERNYAEKALSEKESYLRVLIDNIPFLVWLKDTQSRFLAVNQLLAQQLGLSSMESIVGKTDFDFYPPEKAKQYQRDDQEVLASRQRKTLEEDSNDHFEVRRWTEISLAPVIDKNGEPLGTLGFARDITSRKSVEADLRIAATAFESQEGIFVTDADTVILKVNHSFTRITGYTAEEAIGRKMNLSKSEVQNAAFYAEMWEKINHEGNWQGEIWNRRKDGEIYPEWLSITAVKSENESVSHYVGTMIDITARKAIEEQMRHMAHHDVLTDLPNRILLADRLQQAIAQARRDNTKLALMYIDLDKFKPVNDNFGHDIGDLLLKEVASRLLICMKRESDTVSRLGGDEFVTLLPNIEKEQDVAMVAEKILHSLSHPFTIGKNLINISSSIGIAIFPTHGADALSLMKNADNAMYQAKNSGRSCFRFYVDRA